MRSLLSVLKFQKQDLKIYILLLSAPVLLTLYRYHGYAEFFGTYFPSLKDDPNFDLYAHIWQFGVFFLLMFMVPLFLIKKAFKQSIFDFGFGLGDKKYGFLFVLITGPLIAAPAIYFASKMPDVRSEYPLAKILLERHDLIVFYELAYVLLYYVAWEFFFRGFLLFGLKDRFGSLNAVLIQTISSCLIHIGKPEGEIIGSIIVGVIFGALALRTRSIWFVFLLHVLLGLLTDLFIIFL